MSVWTGVVRAVLLLALTADAAAHADQAAELASAKAHLRGEAGGWPKALSLFQAVAKQGNPAGAYYLALMYKNGMGTARDSAAAAHWCEVAAERQVPAAMFLLANMYYSGDGVVRDWRVARSWIERAAELEYPEAALLMAHGLREGNMGFERDTERAEQQLQEAAHALKHRPAEP